MHDVTVDQILSFRWAKHGLAKVLPNERWREALATAPLQDSPPMTSMPIALAARAEAGAVPFSRLLKQAWESEEILAVNGLRFAPLFCLPQDFAAITLGILPDSPGAWRSRLSNIAPKIEAAGMDCEGAAFAAMQALDALLLGGPVRHNDLCEMLKHNMPPPLLPLLRDNRYAAAHFVLAACGTGKFVLRPRIGNQRVFARSERPPVSGIQARRRLVEMFLGAYAPAEYADLARYAGIAAYGSEGGIQELEKAWDEARDHCVEVRLGKKKLLVPREDLPMLLDGPSASGMRLLPPCDAYLRQDKREWLLPSPAYKQIVFPIVSPPCTVLVDGKIAGILRLNIKNGALAGSADLFMPFAPEERENLKALYLAAVRARGFEPGGLAVVM